MGRINAPGVYRIGQYSWIANPDLLLSGQVVPRFKLVVSSFVHPDTGKPARQKVISILTGIPESRISEYMVGKRPISPSNLRKFCILFNLPPEELLGVVEVEDQERVG